MIRLAQHGGPRSGVAHPNARVVRGCTVQEWAWLLGLTQQALSWRLKHWGEERALATRPRTTTCRYCRSAKHTQRRCPVKRSDQREGQAA